MRSSAETPTGLELDVWIVANAIVRFVRARMTEALVRGRRASRAKGGRRWLPGEARPEA